MTSHFVRTVYACPAPVLAEEIDAFSGEPCASESCSNMVHASVLGLDSAGKFHGPYCHEHTCMAVIEPMGVARLSEQDPVGNCVE